MTSRFDTRSPYVIVRARVRGPAGEVGCLLALDTGSTWTLIAPKTLVTAGYDPGAVSPTVDMVTATERIRVGRLEVEGLSALGLVREGMPVVCHQLPAGLRVGGLLGLDFVRGRKLEIDFTQGTVDLR